MTILLKANSISKTFPGVRALDDVGLTVRSGEIHALMGENGAGKSTLIKVLTGVHRPDSGEISIGGETVRPGSPKEAEAAGISTVFQEVNLVPALSVAENILLGRQPRRGPFIRWGRVRERAKAALERLGLPGIDVDRPVGSLSMAVQQMVAIARALDVAGARILILDEPTSSLDEAETKQLFRVLSRLRKKGLGIVFVTHFLEQVYEICDRITVLRNGRFVGEFETTDLPRLKLVEKMLGREAGEESSKILKEKTDSAGEVFLRTRELGRKGNVEKIDLELRKGEAHGLAGLLGSGRTETARLLFGADRADAGEIEIEEKPVSLRSPRDAILFGIGFSSEDRKGEGVIPSLSVRENLVLAMQASRGIFRKLPFSKQKELAEKFIERLSIRTPSMETPMENLSGGNQQKVLLARWLCMEPRLLILDEPTRGIDIGAKEEIERVIGEICGRGVSVLFVSSELEEIVRVCGRVTVLRDRRQAGEFSGEEVEAGNILRAIAKTEGENL